MTLSGIFRPLRKDSKSSSSAIFSDSRGAELTKHFVSLRAHQRASLEHPKLSGAHLKVSHAHLKVSCAHLKVSREHLKLLRAHLKLSREHSKCLIFIFSVCPFRGSLVFYSLLKCLNLKLLKLFEI